MGLFDLFNSKKKADLLELQRLVLVDSPNRLTMSEKQLIKSAENIVKRDLEITKDCIRILKSTTKPDTFFSRLDLLIEKADKVRKFEKYIRFSVSPSLAYNELLKDYQECIYQFLVRYFCETFDAAEKLKTESGKRNRYQKFYDSLQPYRHYMNDDNIDYIETKFKAYTRCHSK